MNSFSNRARVGGLLLVLVPLAAGAAPHKFHFRSVNVKNSVETKLFGVNNKGTSIGTFATPADQTAEIEHGFTRTSFGHYKYPIDVPGSVDTDANGINDESDIVGTYATPGTPDNVDHCYLLDDGIFAVFDMPPEFVGAQFPDCSGINNRGDTVGSYYDPAFGPWGNDHGWLRKANGKFIQLDYPGALSTEAAGINNEGDIVGFWYDGTNEHGFLYDDGSYISIDFPGSNDTNAFGINNRGEIVGSYTTPGGFVDHNFLRLKDGSFITVDLQGVQDNNGIHGINDSGTMVGTYTDTHGNNEGFITKKTD